MNAKEIISNSITFPFTKPLRTLGLGLLLSFWFLIVPIVLASGYKVRIIKKTIQGEKEVPTFEEWSDMLWDGMKYLIVYFTYIITGIFCLYQAFLLLMLNSIFSETAPLNFQFLLSNLFTSTMGWLVLVLLIMGIVFFILGYILFLIGIPHMAVNNRFGAAFDIKNILKNIKKLGWGTFIMPLIVFGLISILLMVLSQFLTGFFVKYGLYGFILVSVLTSLFLDSFLYVYQGRLMGLFYVLDEEDIPKKPSARKPRFSKDPEVN